MNRSRYNTRDFRGERTAPFATLEPMMENSAAATERKCPWCGSPRIQLTTRGYAGLTDERDQYFSCAECGKVTYEMVAKSAREMRLGRFRSGGVYQDRANHTRYTISRVLKVGVNEFLIYLKPVTTSEATPTPTI